MLDGIASSFCSSAFSNAATLACAGDSVRYTSVLPHQSSTRRSSLCVVLETADVLAQLLGELALVLALLDVRSVEPLHVAPIEHRRHRRDCLELGADLIEQRLLQHAGGLRRFVRVVLEDVPAAEHDVVERGERHEVLDERRATFGALAEANGSHLRQRADRLGEAASHGQHPGDRGRADGAHPDEQTRRAFPQVLRFSEDFSRSETISSEWSGSGPGPLSPRTRRR